MTTETKVGVFVVAALALLAVTIYGVHTTQTVRGQVPFKTYLRDAGGLDADASVLFGGIKVGQITTVHPDTDDPTRIEIAFEVNSSTPMNRQSMARVATVSLMGSPALQITTGSNEAPRLAPGDAVPIGRSRQPERPDSSRRHRRRQRQQRAARSPARNSGDRRPGAGRAGQRRHADRRRQPAADSGGAGRHPALVNDADEVIVSAKPLVANIDQTVSNVNRTFDSVRGTVDSAREPLVDDLKALHDTLDEARGAIGSVQGVVQTNEDDFAETMRALRTTTENLRSISEQLKQRPWNLIRTTQADDRKVPR